MWQQPQSRCAGWRKNWKQPRMSFSPCKSPLEEIGLLEYLGAKDPFAAAGAVLCWMPQVLPAGQRALWQANLAGGDHAQKRSRDCRQQPKFQKLQTQVIYLYIYIHIKIIKMHLRCGCSFHFSSVSSVITVCDIYSFWHILTFIDSLALGAPLPHNCDPAIGHGRFERGFGSVGGRGFGSLARPGSSQGATQDRLQTDQCQLMSTS